MDVLQLVEVTIDRARVDWVTNTRTVALQDAEGDLSLLILIGASEAQALGQALAGQPQPRPAVHEVALRLIAPLGGTIERVVIHALADQTFRAEITLAHGRRHHMVEARASDALILATYAGAPIYVTRALLDADGVVLAAPRLQEREVARPES